MRIGYLDALVFVRAYIHNHFLSPMHTHIKSSWSKRENEHTCNNCLNVWVCTKVSVAVCMCHVCTCMHACKTYVRIHVLIYACVNMFMHMCSCASVPFHTHAAINYFKSDVLKKGTWAHGKILKMYWTDVFRVSGSHSLVKHDATLACLHFPYQWMFHRADNSQGR